MVSKGPASGQAFHRCGVVPHQHHSSRNSSEEELRLRERAPADACVGIGESAGLLQRIVLIFRQLLVEPEGLSFELQTGQFESFGRWFARVESGQFEHSPLLSRPNRV